MAALTFRQALARASILAAQSLPEELHERLSAAAALVKAGNVFQHSDGTWQVASSSTAGLVYRTNGSCDCDDMRYNNPPQQLCKHRLAMFLSQRALSMMQQSAPAPEPGAAAAACLYEAPCSASVHVTIAGHDVLFTMRDHSETALLERLAKVLAQYPAQAPAPEKKAGAAQGQGEGFCQRHGVQMKWNDAKDGRKGWYSHRHQGEWCKGR